MNRYVLILVSALWLGGCGPEVLTWDEEVLLNTGETIIVHREATYTLSGSGDNPFKMSMHPRPDDMVIYFDYHEKKYRYDGRGNLNLFLLAISPQGTPNLIIHPGGFGWDYQNCFNFCAEPYYAQLIPDATGVNWSFPENIDVWLYELMGNISTDLSYEKIKATKLISAIDIRLRNERRYLSSKYYVSVNPSHKNRDCGSARCSPDLRGRK